jgi:aldose 1-epimerase
MEATTDSPTIVNLVHHSYWNLAGHDQGTIRDHELTIRADAYTPVDDELIPTGEIRPVDGTPFDFRRSRRIGELDLDHNWVLDGSAGPPRPAAVLRHGESGRTMNLETTEPGLQCYTGAGLGGEPMGKSGIIYPARAGVALESQRWPDSPNIAQFPSASLRPDETYHHELILAFAAD